MSQDISDFGDLVTRIDGEIGDQCAPSSARNDRRTRLAAAKVLPEAVDGVSNERARLARHPGPLSEVGAMRADAHFEGIFSLHFRRREAIGEFCGRYRLQIEMTSRCDVPSPIGAWMARNRIRRLDAPLGK